MADIKFPENLNKFIDGLRKKGVKSVEIEGLKLELYEEAPPSNYKRKLEVFDAPQSQQKPMTEEDYLLWSVQQDEASSA